MLPLFTSLSMWEKTGGAGPWANLNEGLQGLDEFKSDKKLTLTTKHHWRVTCLSPLWLLPGRVLVGNSKLSSGKVSDVCCRSTRCFFYCGFICDGSRQISLMQLVIRIKMEESISFSVCMFVFLNYRKACNSHNHILTLIPKIIYFWRYLHCNQSCHYGFASYMCSCFHLARLILKVPATFRLLKPMVGRLLQQWSPYSPTGDDGHSLVRTKGLVALPMTAPASVALLESHLLWPPRITCYPHHNQLSAVRSLKHDLLQSFSPSI